MTSSGKADPAAIPPKFLETPVAQDLQTPHLAHATAADAERCALWQRAFRRLCLTDADSRFQPAPTGKVWIATSCAEALPARRAALDLVRRLAAGELPPPPAGTGFAVPSYYALAPKSAGGPAFALPTRTAELPLDLPAAEFDDEPTERDDMPVEQVETEEDDPVDAALSNASRSLWEKRARRVTPNTAGIAFLVTPILR